LNGVRRIQSTIFRTAWQAAPRRRIDQPGKLPVNLDPRSNSANSYPLNLDKIEQPRVLQFDTFDQNQSA
jgi:hypothetical protein